MEKGGAVILRKRDNDLRLGVLGSDLFAYINDEGKHILPSGMLNYPHSYALPFYITNKGEIMFGFISNFMINNSSDDSLRPMNINVYNWWRVDIYVESLVFPFSIGGTSDTTKTHAGKDRIKTIK
ncbi:hypothetical protein H5410_047172 [Solanum commersonii]|uniref:Uncharacterized protein n=1 Tax=Solanum commersonii TaxID=4109 RepID=A0A9J5XGE7_SOLCO|nr:hypothetical protein H5410_047172 [Solanum commersonii]